MTKVSHLLSQHYHRNSQKISCLVAVVVSVTACAWSGSLMLVTPRGPSWTALDRQVAGACESAASASPSIDQGTCRKISEWTENKPPEVKQYMSDQLSFLAELAGKHFHSCDSMAKQVAHFSSDAILADAGIALFNITACGALGSLREVLDKTESEVKKTLQNIETTLASYSKALPTSCVVGSMLLAEYPINKYCFKSLQSHQEAAYRYRQCGAHMPGMLTHGIVVALVTKDVRGFMSGSGLHHLCSLLGGYVSNLFGNHISHTISQGELHIRNLECKLACRDAHTRNLEHKLACRDAVAALGVGSLLLGATYSKVSEHACSKLYASLQSMKLVADIRLGQQCTALKGLDSTTQLVSKGHTAMGVIMQVLEMFRGFFR